MEKQANTVAGANKLAGSTKEIGMKSYYTGQTSRKHEILNAVAGRPKPTSIVVAKNKLFPEFTDGLKLLMLK